MGQVNSCGLVNTAVVLVPLKEKLRRSFSFGDRFPTVGRGWGERARVPLSNSGW